MYRRPELEFKWPNLSGTDYRVTSPKSQEYNCFAYAAGDTDRCLPPAGSEADRSTIAKLEINAQSFFGINSGSSPYFREITLRVNPITKTHAEADAFQQAADAGVKSRKARLIVDRDPPPAPLKKGGVKGINF